MPKICIPFTGAEIINSCNMYDVDPDPATHHVDGWAVTDLYIRLYNNAAGGHPQPLRFVWFSPDLPVKIAGGVMRVLREKQVPCGFSADNALQYEEVYAVGPFSAQDLAPLLAAGIALDSIAPYNSPKAARDYLDAHL